MIISRTPYRISLFGGGSDYPKWSRRHGGSVFGFAINKYCYISVRPLPPFFEHRHRIAYSKVETVEELDEIEHPAVRAILKERNIECGLEIHHDGDLPARSGLGSSSSFSVGLLHSLNALEGRMSTKRHLAMEAIHIEQNVIKESVGSQDQIWAAFGGMNRINFMRDGSFEVQQVVLPVDRLRQLLDNTLLFFTGFSRFASDIAKEQIENLDKRESHIKRMIQMVDEALEILVQDQRPLREIGTLLHESWRLKRELADSVTNPRIDEIFQSAMDAGAIGGKLIGAGGGGFVVLYVEPDKQPAVKDRFKDLIEVSFDIDRSGSSIVVYEPDGLQNR